jgi:hypothetical protein
MELDNANEQENENLDSTNDETEDATEHENLQHLSHTENPDVNDEQEDLLQVFMILGCGIALTTMQEIF